MIENRRAQEGDPTSLGPLRSRLRAVCGERLSQHGVRTVIELLVFYRETLDSERQKGKSAAAAGLEADAAILARLAECELIPNPLRKIAQGIEYPTALTASAPRSNAPMTSARARKSTPSTNP